MDGWIKARKELKGEIKARRGWKGGRIEGMKRGSKHGKDGKEEEIQGRENRGIERDELS